MAHSVTSFVARLRPARTGWLLVYALAAAFIACSAAVSVASAQAPAAAEATPITLASGEFSRKRKNTRGAWEIVDTGAGRVLRLADNFSTGRGPDIKVFLSPLALGDAKGANATDGAVFLGQLSSRQGAAEFAIPADVDVTAFQSLLIHCEEFSVLFGGAAL